MVTNHDLNPLHSIKASNNQFTRVTFAFRLTREIQKWNGVHFQEESLMNLGLRVQLGHKAKEQCILPIRKDNFVVIDSHGMHTVAVDFCGCQTAQTAVRQLLRLRWFPATVSEPSTAFTYRVLEQFQLLSLESKLSAYEFYNSIARRSDNTGLSALKVNLFQVDMAY